MDSDNQANTHLFGANLGPIMYIRQKCTVEPFLHEYYEQTDVTIVMGGKVFDINNEMTYLLVFGQRLWFGNQMKKSVIILNQCWVFGVMICDDPNNK